MKITIVEAIEIYKCRVSQEMVADDLGGSPSQYNENPDIVDFDEKVNAAGWDSDDKSEVLEFLEDVFGRVPSLNKYEVEVA